MGLRFRQSFQLFPGVRLNLSGSGLSASFGVPGATINVGGRGVRSTVGIPGTGVSFSQSHGGGSTPAPPPQAPPSPTPSPFAYVPPQPSYAQIQAFQMREINSASVESLTSDSLVELRDLIAQARTQRGEIDADLNEATAMHERDDEAVPADTQVAGYTWAKVNKDGSPDRRFNGNYQIPLAVYGRLLFVSAGGIEEEYQFSNASAAAEFARAFTAYQAALSA
jgi:Protein of unknown function (DUF4236)